MDQDVRQAIKLARQGDKAQAQELLKQVLRRDPSNADAWVVLAQIVDSHAEAVSYMKRAINLRPDDERSRRYLDYLLQSELPSPGPHEDAPGPSKTTTTMLVLAAVALALCLGLVVAYILLRPGENEQAQVTDTPIDCETLVAQALTLSKQGCDSIGPNEVCYGHSTIDAELVSGTSDQFDSTGDKVRLDMLEKFVAAPLDLEKKEWGIGVFKVEANVPGSLPGQAVTLLIFGNTSIDNESGDMQAFYFSTGLGSIVCENVPFDGILVRMPDGSGVTFSANGAEITLRGTGVMQAQEGQGMSVSMLSGIGSIFSAGQTQTFGPGQEVTVPMEGREASGPPSEPVTLVEDALTMACTLLGIGCPGTTIPTVSAADLQSTLSFTPAVTTVAQATNVPTYTQRPLDPTRTRTPAPTNTQRPGEPTWTPAPTHTPTKTFTPTKTYTPGGPTVTQVKPTTPPPTTPPPTTPPPTTPPPTTPPPTTPPPTTPPPTTPPPTTPPPTTPPVDPCTLISVSGGTVAIGPNTITYNITNNTAGVITLTGINNITWPTSTYNLKSVKLGTGANSLIWNGTLTSPANVIPDQGNPTISNGVTKPLVLSFQLNIDPAGGHSMTVVFDIGCPKSASG